jgi:hypothetical protein
MSGDGEKKKRERMVTKVSKRDDECRAGVEGTNEMVD